MGVGRREKEVTEVTSVSPQLAVIISSNSGGNDETDWVREPVSVLNNLPVWFLMCGIQGQWSA